MIYSDLLVVDQFISAGASHARDSNAAQIAAGAEAKSQAHKIFIMGRIFHLPSGS